MAQEPWPVPNHRGFDIEFPLAFDDAVGRRVGIPPTDGGLSMILGVGLMVLVVVLTRIGPAYTGAVTA